MTLKEKQSLVAVVTKEAISVDGVEAVLWNINTLYVYINNNFNGQALLDTIKVKLLPILPDFSIVVSKINLGKECDVVTSVVDALDELEEKGQQKEN